MIKQLNIDLGNEVTQVNLYPLGDLHVGSTECNMDEIKNTIERIEADPLAKVILMGDLVDNITKTSKGNVYKQIMTPQEQIDTVIQILSPIKNKIIGAISGNHENRAEEAGFDISRMIAYALGITQNYNREGLYIFLSYGIKDRKPKIRHTVRIYATHGMGGTVNTAVEKMQQVCDADVYVCGHIHGFKNRVVGYFNGEKRANGTLSLSSRALVVTTAYLNYGGYAQLRSYQPAIIHQPVIELSYKLIKSRERDVVRVY